MLSHGHRHERLADQIRIEVAEMIEGELRDPRIGFATVTGVELSPDLRHARVRVSGTGAEEGETLAGLSSAAGYVRREIGSRLRLRRAPEIVFELDRGVEGMERVQKLLDEIKREG
ncbi:MAG: 30S ribosome-binding factor RbfA [Acidobacteriia bacterium]|nr:30S ribosome-binding factor RbfA [Terriglobia bacterium]